MKQTQGRGESGAACTQQKSERLPEFDDDALLTLEEAARRAFPSGGGTAETLKRKIRKGQLTSYRPGKAYMTTMRDVKAMIVLCAVPAKRNSIAAIDQDLDALLKRSSDALDAALKPSVALSSARQKLRELKEKPASKVTK
jgi:hypothetical protein